MESPMNQMGPMDLLLGARPLVGAMLAVMMIVIATAEEVPSAFVAEKLGVKEPMAFAVPVSSPVAVFKVMPAGRLPLTRAKLVGLLLAAI
jgi:hypothetical protein